MDNRKVVKVFLASPGDMTEERRAARAVVDEVNSIWGASMGYQIDLVGWEETVSSHGRPQELINRDLEQCELFYGMIWKRWGTPPSKSGPFTSGFEEEFVTSLERCKISGRPSRRLAFKAVDPDLLRDPGPELSKVISFKQRLVEDKEMLFENFDDIADFQFKFRRCISLYIQELSVLEAQAKDQPSGPPKSDAVPLASAPLVAKLLSRRSRLSTTVH
jgi:hypothetical protein